VAEWCVRLTGSVDAVLLSLEYGVGRVWGFGFCILESAAAAVAAAAVAGQPVDWRFGKDPELRFRP